MNRTIRSLFAAVGAAAAFAAIPARASASPNREPHHAVPAYSRPPAHVGVHQPARGRFEDRERDYREFASAREHFYAARHARLEWDRFERWQAARQRELERRWGRHGWVGHRY